jgi:hypothetical protein
LHSDQISEELFLEAGPIGAEGFFIKYASCAYENLPLWFVEAELEGGTKLRIEERMEPSLTDTGPASIERAAVEIAGEEFVVAGYFDLVYSAARHNQAPRYRVVLPASVTLPDILRPVRAVELYAAERALAVLLEAKYLDEEFRTIFKPKVLSFKRQQAPEPSSPRFLRGDADASGARDIADAMHVLRYLFQRGNAAPCADAGDANDDGRLNVTDAVTLLLHLFGGWGKLPEPFDACGPDPTPGGMGCEHFEPCS